MKHVIKFPIWLIIILLSLGCATIVSKSVYPLSVNTDPAGVLVVIKDANDIEIFSGKSPAVVDLNAGAKFFKRAFYTVTVSADGYETKTLPVNFTIDGWYFGNLLIGGVIGMLIVDPATGAMYKLDHEYMNVTLSPSDTGDTPTLKVFDITDIPDRLRRYLVRVN